MTALSRRQLITAAAALGASLAIGEQRPWAAGSEVRFDFTRPLDGWETVTGKWGIEDVPGASRGKALVQRATKNAFNVIVAPGGPYTDVDVSVRFKPISGSEDASAGTQAAWRHRDDGCYSFFRNLQCPPYRELIIRVP